MVADLKCGFYSVSALVPDRLLADAIRVIGIYPCLKIAITFSLNEFIATAGAVFRISDYR